MYGPVAAAALLGLATIPHCMGMCGPLAGACASSRGATLAYQASRLLTYGLLGGLASTIASPIREALPHGLAAYLLAAVMAASLLTSALRLHRTAKGRPDVPVQTLVRPKRSHPMMPVALGMLTGILPCGSLYGALAVAAAAPNHVLGAGTMLTFGAVSSVGLYLSQAAASLLARDTSGRGRTVVAGVLALGAVLALARPLVADAPDGASCHEPASHVALAPSGATR